MPAAAQATIGSNTQFGSVEDVVRDPVACGFLRAFALREHNSENLDFWIAVDRFHDAAATHSPKQLRRLSNRLFETFISEESTTEVSLDNNTRAELLARRESEREPAADLYDAAQLKALQTLRRDMYPRFRSSPEMKLLQARLAQPAAGQPDVLVPLPLEAVAEEAADLADMLSQPVLLEALHAYVRKRYCAEHLLFCVAVMHYQHRAAAAPAGDPRLPTEAWQVYSTFLRDETSLCYVQLSAAQQKEVALGLATATAALFREPLKSALFLLRRDVAAFFSTPEYVVARDAFVASHRPRGCFAFLSRGPAIRTPSMRYRDESRRGSKSMARSEISVDSSQASQRLTFEKPAPRRSSSFSLGRRKSGSSDSAGRSAPVVSKNKVAVES